MAKLNLTITLHLKIVLIVVFLMITITAYNHLLYWHEEDDKSIERLMAITNYLVKKTPPKVFSELSPQPSATNALTRDHVFNLNKKLQPIVSDIFTPVTTVKFGFYSLKYESIIAVAPNCDPSMLIGVDPTLFNVMHTNTTGQLIEKKNSLLWPDANTVTYIKPIIEDGVVVAYAFACRNQDALVAAIWERTANILLGTFLIMVLCIGIFRELFVKLKEQLYLLGKSILAEKSYDYNCEIAEFNPILKCISEKTHEMIHLDRLNIISEMAAGIAHEIRNPMTTVRDLLNFMNNKEEFTMQKKNLTLMIKELDRANSIITEFLLLAKNTAMFFREHNLNTVIQEISPLLQADALSNNCQIELALSNIPNVYIDPRSIRQLLLNMVTNALDAMPKGGIVTISTKNTASKILLSITDSGVGIPAKIKEKIGTPFFTTKEYGTGLSLAICYSIIQRHSGRITVESEPGNGTTFTIELNPM